MAGFNARPVTSPLIVVAGGAMYKVNLETKASAVSLADGADAQSRLGNVAGGALFVANAAGLATLKCLPGQFAVNMESGTLNICMPDKSWRKVCDLEAAV